MSHPAQAGFYDLAFAASFMGLLLMSRSLTFMIRAMTYPCYVGSVAR